MKTLEIEVQIEALQNHWKSQRYLRLADGLPLSEIAHFEQRNNVCLPADFSRYLTFANGFKKSEDSSGIDASDDEGFEFYPLADERLISKRYLVFSGWPNGFLEYALCVGPRRDIGRVVQIIDKSRGYLLAKTFTDFIGLYLTDSKLLYSPGAVVVSID